MTQPRRGLIPRARAFLRAALIALRPGRRAWNGATVGIALVVVVSVLITAWDLMVGGGPGHAGLGAICLLAAFALVGGVLTLVWAVLRRLSPGYVWAVASLLGVIVFMGMTALSIVGGVIGVGMVAILLVSLLGGVAAELLGGGWHAATRGRRVVLGFAGVVGLAGLIAGGVWLLGRGRTLPPLAEPGGATAPLALPDPSLPGPYTVRTLTYGSGTDRRRPEYAADVVLRTTPVDGSPFVEGWNALRTAYWGFGVEALPRNARVWYPEGEGPFPLILFLHGQHAMVEDSDAGYGYLGELLASRGAIVASVDENFLNLSPLTDLLVVGGLKGENDLRGWLLLEHLALWRTWATTPGSPFAGKVDLDRIVLVGHSRGGEAVAIAAAFNRLSHYPDDGTVAFNYDFGIRGVVAIAPVDRTYLPADRTITLHDVSYLVLHGSHDMDVFVYQGSGQYGRVVLGTDSATFKAGLYVYGANHGQFNTVWGRKDLFEPLMRLFNLRQLIPAEDQQQVARVAISAFVEATVNGEESYRALFQDPRRAEGWLPETVYLGQYQDAQTHLVSNYEEDADLATTTLAGGSQCAAGLTLWHEGVVPLKWEDAGNHAVSLGWSGAPATYTIALPAAGPVRGGSGTLVFEMAQSREAPVAEDEGQDGAAPRAAPLDLTVVLADAAGRTAGLPLSAVAPLPPQIEGQLGKAAFMSLLPTSEPVLAHYELPLDAFAVANGALDLAALTEIRFVFDRSPAGVILLDDVGFRTP